MPIALINSAETYRIAEKPIMAFAPLMLVLVFLAKSKTVIMFQPLVKTEDTDERKAFCYD